MKGSLDISLPSYPSLILPASPLPPSLSLSRMFVYSLLISPAWLLNILSSLLLLPIFQFPSLYLSTQSVPSFLPFFFFFPCICFLCYLFSSLAIVSFNFLPTSCEKKEGKWSPLLIYRNGSSCLPEEVTLLILCTLYLGTLFSAAYRVISSGRRVEIEDWAEVREREREREIRVFKWWDLLDLSPPLHLLPPPLPPSRLPFSQCFCCACMDQRR